MPAESGTNATFYHYRLLKKLVIPKTLIYSLLTLPLIWLAAEIVLFTWTSIFFFLLAIPIALWIQYVIARSVLVLQHNTYRKRWRFTRRLPWIGYMPDQYVSYSVYRRVQIHTSWIGLVIIGIMIPWSPMSFVFSLFFWHAWSIAPRLYPLFGFNNQPKEGMIKFNEEDISYYMP